VRVRVCACVSPCYRRSSSFLVLLPWGERPCRFPRVNDLSPQRVLRLFSRRSTETRSLSGRHWLVVGLDRLPREEKDFLLRLLEQRLVQLVDQSGQDVSSPQTKHLRISR
jgi:hypothetical protein